MLGKFISNFFPELVRAPSLTAQGQRFVLSVVWTVPPPWIGDTVVPLIGCPSKALVPS